MSAAQHGRPHLDTVAPDMWKASGAFSGAVNDGALTIGLSLAEVELVKIRASQLNGCVSCLDLHSRKARAAGVPQQKLDVLPAWRDTDIYTERERAVLAVAEAATRMPLSEDSAAELVAARSILGETHLAVAEWVAVSINLFNRVSILSGHTIRPRLSEEQPR